MPFWHFCSALFVKRMAFGSCVLQAFRAITAVDSLGVSLNDYTFRNHTTDNSPIRVGQS